MSQSLSPFQQAYQTFLQRLSANGDLQYLEEFDYFSDVQKFVTHSLARAILVAMHRGDLPESNPYLYQDPFDMPRNMDDMVIEAMGLLSPFTVTFQQFVENYPVLDAHENKADLLLPEDELMRKAIVIGVLIDWIAEFNQPRHKTFKPYDLKNAIRLARKADNSLLSEEPTDGIINEAAYQEIVKAPAFLRERKHGATGAVIHLRHATDLLKLATRLFEPDPKTPPDKRATAEYAPLSPDWVEDASRFTRMQKTYAETVGHHINLPMLEVTLGLEGQTVENLDAAFEAFQSIAFDVFDDVREIFERHDDMAKFAGRTVAQAYRIQSMREQLSSGVPNIHKAVEAAQHDSASYTDAFAYSLRRAYDCIAAPNTILTGEDVKDAYITLSAFATGLGIAIECYEQILHGQLFRPDAKDYEQVEDGIIAKLCASETFLSSLPFVDDDEGKVMNASKGLEVLHLAGEFLDNPVIGRAPPSEDDTTEINLPSSVLPLLDLYDNPNFVRERLGKLTQLAGMFNETVGREIGTYIGDFTS
jgi:hypothetical protein